MSRSALVKSVIVGIAALVALAAVPFVQSLSPIPAVGSLTQTVNLSTVPLDSFVEVEWKGNPVVIFRPGPQTLNELVSINGLTNGPFFDPESRPPAFIYHRLSTFRGCGLVQSPKGHLGPEWKGGWMDPCHIGAWDYAGRRVNNANGTIELLNLTVPKHRFLRANAEVELL